MGYSETIYYDTITMDILLVLYDTIVSEPIIPGMLFGVKSKFEGVLLQRLLSGMLSQEEYEEKMVGIEDNEYDKTRIDLKNNYRLWKLENFTVDQLKKYLELYTERLKPRMRPEKRLFMEANMEALKEYLILNFSHLTPYTGVSGYKKDYTLTKGSIVFANTKVSNPPTFLYFEFGLIDYTVICKEPKKMMESDQEDEACGSYSASASEDGEMG